MKVDIDMYCFDEIEGVIYAKQFVVCKNLCYVLLTFQKCILIKCVPSFGVCFNPYKSIIQIGVRHSTYRDARGVAHSYFFSWEHAPTRNLEVDWLDARNICRRHCMDAVSLETPQVSWKRL